MNLVAIENKLPDVNTNVLLQSKNGDWFTGKYVGNGNFRIVSKCELQEDGQLLQLTTSCHSSYFSHWMELVSA